MAYPNLSPENDSGGAFTVELTEKNQPINQEPQVGVEAGMDDKETSAPHNGEQRQLLASDPDIRRPRLNTAQRVSFV